MRCEFIVSAAGGINVIPEFEVDRLCLLEGRNGIGKTLAVRLLELATGRQPYVASQAAWNSLREGIGELRIRISGLQDGDVLEIELIPSMWSEDPTKGPMELGRAWYNGQIIDSRAIPKILRVTRIGGDEDIIAQFQRVIAADATVVSRQKDRLDAFINRLNDIDHDLDHDLKAVSRTTLNQLIAQREQAEDRLVLATQMYEQQDSVVQTLDQLNRKQAALHHLQEQGPDIELRLAEIEVELSKLQLDISQLEDRYEQHLPDVVLEKNLVNDIEQLRRKQTRQTELLRTTETKLNGLLTELRLTSVNDIVGAQQQAITQRDERLRDRELLATRPNLRALISELLFKMEAARGTALDKEVVVNIGKRSIQVRELRDGLVQRDNDLARREQQTFLEVIDSEIQSLEERLQLLASAMKLKTEYLQKQGALRTTEDLLNTKIAELDTNRDAEYCQTVEDLQQLRQEELVLIREQATLRHTRSVLEEYGTADELMAEIMSIQGKLPATVETFDEAQGKLTIYQNRLQGAREEQGQTKDALKIFEQKLEDTLKLLNESPGYAWLRAFVADKLPTMSDDRDVVLERLARLEHAISRLERVLDTWFVRTGGLQSALEGLAQNHTQNKFNEYLTAIVAHYEERFGMLLADQNVQYALFDKGKFMRLDLQQQMVIWENSDGDICRRPLDAFSSGERAFAYVLGSILQQRQTTSRNHLLVLDEFGAFIEAGRIERLERFLHDEVIQTGGASAVVIILPLRKPLTVGDDGSVDLLDRRTCMLVERGYIWDEAKVSV